MWRIYFLLLFEAALASTFVPPEFEHLALVVRDVANHTISSEGLEIHSFRGGRKKRYVFERAEESGPCCDEKRCRSLRGEFLDKKCRCKKCPKSKVPGPDGKSCQDKCGDGTTKAKGTRGCCREGQQMNKKKTACETKPDRRGKCEPGFMVDPKSGPKKSSKKPDCTPDDEMQCKPGEKAQTRQPGDNDPKKKQACGKPDPNDEKKRKCNPKKEYEHYDVTTDGNGNNGVAKKSCKRTKKYEKNKKSNSRFERFKKSKKEAWERDKDKRNARKDENKKKLNDKKNAREAKQAADKAKYDADKAKQEKEQNDKDKKKKRMGLCFPVTALFETLRYKGTTQFPKGDANPYEWLSEFFDISFLEDDEVLDYWPSDVDIDKANAEINEEKFKEQFAIGVDLRNRGQKLIIKRSKSDNISVHSLRHRPHKRFIYGFFTFLVNFAVRLARAVKDAMRVVDNILKRLRDNPKLFQPSDIAKNGALAGGRTVTFASMRSAARTIAKNRQFRECVLNGIPLPVTP